MGRVGRWIAAGLGTALVVAVGCQLLAPPRWRPLRGGGWGLGAYRVELRGRVVEAASGLPLAGRGVLVLEFDEGSTDPRTAAAMRRLSEQARRGVSQEVGAFDPESPWWVTGSHHALTDAQGRFRLEIYASHCTCFVDGEEPEDAGPTQRSVASYVLVERNGGEPALIRPPPAGTWTRNAVPGRRHFDDLWATWDLGDLPISSDAR